MIRNHQYWGDRFAAKQEEMRQQQAKAILMATLTADHIADAFSPVKSNQTIIEVTCD